MIDFFAKIQQQMEQNLPFVLYCKPDSDTIIGLLQQNDTLYSVKDFTEKGFIFASFDGNKTYLIPENEATKISISYEKQDSIALKNEIGIPDLVAQKEYESLVSRGIEAINNLEFKKVVLSRKAVLDLNHFDLLSTFKNLVQLYPTTFVYCFFHPKVGIWLGATPEQLLKDTDNIFETIALAGTQKDKGNSAVIWKKKEKEEQQFVTDYIVSKLEKVASKIVVSEPFSVKAGAIWHIKTTISGVLNSDFSLQNVIGLLHPTPAVCGFPKEKSRAFILENENYDRSFYSGFLGELNSIGTSNTISSNLFVNLRCMQIIDSKAILYMGCGITKDSIPEKEWEESQNKAMTMKRVLDF